MDLDQIISKLEDGPLWISGSWVKAVFEAYKRDRAILAPGTGDEIPTASGRVLRIDAGTTAAVTQNFQCINVSDQAGRKIRVTTGLLAGSEPDGFSPGDFPHFVLNISIPTGYVYGIVTVDSDGDPDSRTLAVGATVPDDDPAGGTFYQKIGSFTTNGPAFFVATLVKGSQAFDLCGGSEAQWGLQ